HGAGTGRCGIWKRYPVSRRRHRTELALRSRRELFDHGLEGGGRTVAEKGLEWSRPASQTAAAGCKPSASFGPDAGARVAGEGVEEHHLAARHQGSAP